jgi:hypothetical protein
MTGGTNNKNVRTSYVPHMRTRATRNTDLVCIPSSSSSYLHHHHHTIYHHCIIIPSLSYHLSSLYGVITGQSSESPGRTEQSQWLN